MAVGSLGEVPGGPKNCIPFLGSQEKHGSLQKSKKDTFLGSVPASISDFVCAYVLVCVCERPIFSSRNGHFHIVALLN